MYTEENLIGLRVRHLRSMEEYTITHFVHGRGCTINHARGDTESLTWFTVEDANRFITEKLWEIVESNYEIY